MESAGGLAVEFPVLMGRKLDIALKDLSRTKPPPPPIKYLGPRYRLGRLLSVCHCCLGKGNRGPSTKK